METTLFLAYVAKFFPGLVVRITKQLNDTNNPLTYLYKTMLRVEQSVDGKWSSINTSNSLVMADIVAMDSPLPLKKRDSVDKATGDIPKMGMKKYLNEKQMSDIDVLIAQNSDEAQIIAKLFTDLPSCIGGVYERLEKMFLEALSSGVTLVEDMENTGTGVRLDMGYKSANKFGVNALWSNPTTAKPFDDIQRVREKANTDGNTISVVMLDSATFLKLANTDQAKQLFAFSKSFVGGNVPRPSLTQINEYVSSEYGFTFKIVDRSVRYEKNGKQTAIKPWQAGSVIFLPSEQVGVLTWTRLAEQTRPVSGVTYQVTDLFILLSKYSKNDPLAEWTSSQARVVPVITNVDQIYQIDTTQLQA